MLKQASLPDLFNVTSSPALAAGATPCALPDGPRIDLFGRAVARANLLAQPVPGGALPTNAISGLPGSTSSASADLTLSLVSKLKQRLTTDGLTLFSLTWREKVTPAGRLVSRLAASGRRTSDNDFGLWQTPKALDGVFSTPRTTGRPMHRATHLQTQTIALLTNADPTLASWPTPRGPHGCGPSDAVTRGLTGEGAAQLASWPTTTVTDAHRGERYDPMAKNMMLNMAAQRTSWPTPQTMDTLPPMDYERRLNHPGRPGRTVSGNLREVVTLTSWPMPMEHEARLGFQDRSTGKKGSQKSLTTVVVESLAPDNDPRLSGLTAIGSPAATEKPGQLNPAHSRWLMGVSGRVGRLRAYGNAIVPQVAQVFIEAYLES